MNQRLKEVASSGDIDSLYSIIQDDPSILDRVDQVPFVDTPLHISASAGHVHFSLEIMRLKPSFARKLDPEGYSPIHVALQNNRKETVFRLIDIDRDLISVQGREGLTPMHIAASGGKDDMLAKFLISCPKSIKQLTIRKESAMHIAVKNGDIQSFQILLEWIHQACITSMLYWSDDEGNNIMHLAALGNQTEMMKLLLRYKLFVDMKSKNLEGKTAVDIMNEQAMLELDEELKGIFLDNVANDNNVKKHARLGNMFWSTISFLKRLALSDHHEVIYMSKKDRNAILVVSVLIATATYQALLTPPDNIDDLGAPIMYDFFRCFNTLAFIASMIEICLHLPSGIGYALHLVLPLVICYALLMVVFWSASTVEISAAVTFVLVLTKIPLVRQKISGDLKPKKLIKLDALFKRNPSLEREFNEINTSWV